MIAEFGQICLALALVIAVMQGTLPLFGAWRGDDRFMRFADSASKAQFLLLLSAYIALTAIFISTDFSVDLAARHSHTEKPLIYRISGVWGNHEGSILLWVLIVALYGVLAAIFGRHLPLALRARALAIQGWLGAGFLAFLIFTSNPFTRLNPVPMEGMGLNPILQDPGLAIHPPLLYLGYVGFSLPFSFAIAALLDGRVDAIWARWLRPWVLLAWSFLTLGIAVGSIWAYYELGWGGWWMWDPVENVSFMPWLVGTALLHSILVLGTRHTMAGWTILLAIAAFSLSLIGTFIVRSGVLVSVHAFAVDPARGVVILALLGLFTGGALTLYALRSHLLAGGPQLDTVSRGGALTLNNLLLVAATATVFLGTFYPLFIDVVSADKLSVGAPYFNLTFTPIMLILIAFMAVGPMLKWRRDSLARLRPFALKAGIAAIIVAALTYLFGKSVWGALGMAAALWLIWGTLAVMARKLRLGSGAALSLKQLTASDYGFALAHLGLAVTTLGIAAMGIWAKEDNARLQLGESLEVAGYTYTLSRIGGGNRDNYGYMIADISVEKDGRDITRLYPEQRYYPSRDMVTTEARFRIGLKDTLFAAIGEGDEERGFVMRVYYHPFVSLIWLGALLMALAGFVSIFDRRLRFTKEAAS